MLISFKNILDQAKEGGYAVCYCEAWDIYSLEAVVEAAEIEGLPIIIGFGGVMMEPDWFNHGGLERLGGLGAAAAKAARVPVSLILNEVATYSQVVRGIQAGFNAVMLDTSSLPYAKNVRLTRQVVETAHAIGIGVEAELGTLPDASGEMDGHEGKLTDPEEAARFITETGIDALSVSIGNVHVLTKGQASIDYERLAAIHQLVNIPLVLHGGSGFPEEAIPRSIALGIVKVNIGTSLKQSFLDGIVEATHNLDPNPKIQQIMGSRKEADILQHGKLRMRNEVVRRLRLWSHK